MTKTALNKIQELYLDSNYNVISDNPKEIKFTLKFKYSEDKISYILLYNSQNSLLCTFTKNDIEAVNLNKLSKLNIYFLQTNIKKYNQNSTDFKKAFMDIFLYQKCISQNF